jgi:hypothetical protein
MLGTSAHPGESKPARKEGPIGLFLGVSHHKTIFAMGWAPMDTTS